MINNKKKKGNFIIRLLRKIYGLKILNPFRKYIDKLKIRIERSIRFELMVVISICFAFSFLFYAMANDLFTTNKEEANVTYNYDNIEYRAKSKVELIEENKELTINDSDFLNKVCNENFELYSAKSYIADLDGNIIYKSSNVEEDKVDIFSLLTNAINEKSEEGEERKYIYPINIGNDRVYFIYSDIPTAYIDYVTYEVNKPFLALFLSVIVFAIIFISITNKKMKYLDEIAVGLKIIANEDLEYRIREEGSDEIRNLATNINYMADEIGNKIDAERRAEQTKADLITNVSHDLRTPLTSIMGYIGLVRDGKYPDEKTMREYLNIAFTKSEKLKMLIEDLFEYTKLNNSGIKINKTKINLAEFIFQVSEEFMPLFDDNNIKLIKSSKPEEKIIVNIDPDKMLRVFENLFTNAAKYSYKPGNVVLAISRYKDNAIIAIRNKGDNIPKEKIERLFDRFYRVEESRSTQTGGTGLGLAISKNIVELHGGGIWAECYGNDISFYVKLKIENN